MQFFVQLFWETRTEAIDLASQTRQINHFGWLDAASKYS